MPAELFRDALPIDTKAYTLNPGEIREVAGRHGFLQIQSITAGAEDLLSISYSGSRFNPFPKGYYLTGFQADRVFIRNDHVSAITVRLTIGSGELRDARFELKATSVLPILGSVDGKEAHGVAVTANPMLIGGRAADAEPTAVANGQHARFMADLCGRQIVSPYTPPELILRGQSAAMTGTADTSVIAAQGANVRIYVTSLLLWNKHATVATEVAIKDNATEMFRVYLDANNGTRGGPVALNFPVPLRLSANVALNAANITTGSDTRVFATGYRGR